MAGSAQQPPKTVDPTQIMSTVDRKTTRSPVETPGSPTPGLSPEQEKIQRLEAELAAALARRENPPAAQDRRAPTSPQSETDTILIHFVADGFTALGNSWYRGQELEFKPNSQAYRDTMDRNGESWLDMDDAAQLRRFKKVYFRRGRWPGETYKKISPLDYPALKALNGNHDIPTITKADLTRAQQMEDNRRRAAPHLPKIPGV